MLWGLVVAHPLQWPPRKCCLFWEGCPCKFNLSPESQSATDTGPKPPTPRHRTTPASFAAPRAASEFTVRTGSTLAGFRVETNGRRNMYVTFVQVYGDQVWSRVRKYKVLMTFWPFGVWFGFLVSTAPKWLSFHYLVFRGSERINMLLLESQTLRSGRPVLDSNPSFSRNQPMRAPLFQLQAGVGGGWFPPVKWQETSPSRELFITCCWYHRSGRFPQPVFILPGKLAFIQNNEPILFDRCLSCHKAGPTRSTLSIIQKLLWGMCQKMDLGELARRT